MPSLTPNTKATAMAPTTEMVAAVRRSGGKGARRVMQRWPGLEPDWETVAAEARRQKEIAARRRALRADDPLIERHRELRRQIEIRRYRREQERAAADDEGRKLARRLLACRPGNTKSARKLRAAIAEPRPLSDFAAASLRQLAVDALAALMGRRGWRREHRSDFGSVYVTRGDWRLRLSAHELPDTPERRHNHGQGWSCCNCEIVVGGGDAADWREALRQAAEIVRDEKETTMNATTHKTITGERHDAGDAVENGHA
jgi:hypothetical protein